VTAKSLLDRALAFAVDPVVLATLLAWSTLTFAASLIGVPWYVARVPADYFSRSERESPRLPSLPRSRFRLVGRALKNAVGIVLVLSGLAMFVLPGQGLITLLVGVLLCDFPVKRTLARRIVATRPVLRIVNALRSRAGPLPHHLEVLQHHRTAQ
jgi:hypothetical protein